MARRTNAYESRKGDDGLEALSNVLSADLRGAIRSLVSGEVYNDDIVTT